jgi:hypothetical protein
MAYTIDPAYEAEETTNVLPQYGVDYIIEDLTKAGLLEKIETFPDNVKYQLYKELNKRGA